MEKKRRFRIRQIRPARRRTKRDQALFYNSPAPVVSVIIPVMNEHRTIGKVIREASRVHPRTEVIVVANGCTDRSAKMARKLGAIVLEYTDPLGHDVPRAVGARQAKGEVLLFIDGDMLIPAKDLRPFAAAILSGSDVALNDYEGPVQTREVHPVVSAKHMLNTMLGRSDLKGASLTAVPHAISRQAVSRIGYETLEQPPLALAASILEGLTIRLVHSVDVGRLNRPRIRSKHGDLLTGVILGDHLEAAQLVMKQRGPRGGYTDLGRLRERAR